MMNLFYRGYVIHEDIRELCYVIYDRRPNRTELVIAGDYGEAMTWVDRQVAASLKDGQLETESVPWLSWPEQDEPTFSPW